MLQQVFLEIHMEEDFLDTFLSVGINWQTLYKNYYVIIKLLK